MSHASQPAWGQFTLTSGVVSDLTGTFMGRSVARVPAGIYDNEVELPPTFQGLSLDDAGG